MPRLAAFVFSMSIASLAAAASATAPAIDALFRLPNVRSPRVSPDGTMVAFLYPHDQRMALGVFDRQKKESRMVVEGADESLYAFFWKGNDRLVFEADVAGNESMFIGSTDLSGKKVLRLAESQRMEDYLVGTTARIIDPLSADNNHIAVEAFFVDNVDEALYLGGSRSLATINVRNNGRSQLLELKESDRPYDYVLDHSGALRIMGKVVGKDLVWLHRRDNGSTFREFARYPFHGYVETWEPLKFAADNITLWIIARDEYDRGALYAFNTRTMTRGPALFVPPEGEIGDHLGRDERGRIAASGLIVAADGMSLDGVAYESERLHHHWFNPERAALQASLESVFKGCDVRITSTSEDDQVALVHVSYDREPGTYFLLDRKAGSLTEFKRTRDIEAAQLQPMEPITYTARDGLPIHGYLTRPPGSKGKRVPLVIHPHGGPFGIRDYWGYDGEVQFLVSRGYAVLQPNYRGSGGYGRSFVDKGRYQWGRAMQDDLTDAVKWAIDQGIADPQRIAIYGASYGGYAALAGVTLTPDLYCCAVNYVGPTDLNITFKNRGDDAFLQAGEFNFQEAWVGPTAEYRAQTSPVNLVQRIDVPILNAYGVKDPRVKLDHWSRFEPELKRFGKTYESIEEPRQGHGFRDEKASIRFCHAVEDFFARYLAPARAAPAKQ